MVADSRDFKHHGRKRVYVCGQHRERGNTVCANRLAVPMDAADRAVLDAFERDCLRPHIVAAAVEKALRKAVPTTDEPPRRDEIAKELRAVEQELARYVKAIGHQDELASFPSIIAEIKEREERKTKLTARLASLCHTVVAFDRAKLKAEITSRLKGWQGLMRRNPAEARQLLTKLLKGRLVFEPKEDAEGRY